MEINSLKRKAVCNLVFLEMYKNNNLFSNYRSKFLQTKSERKNNLAPNNKNAIIIYFDFR
ncbi:hypothetical protein B1J93_00975 [Leptospira kirschneri serovar Pomona]|uniref:Uncharacterized protein n=1 Tax=Leptospira kirschneri serovar Pomona TaxID=561005 RepID=A0A1T1E360_9LEPT|nr:hypothetical protein B1J93_00975 [Leptospira kirschneri serovar Pomona]